jgi:hypothetical protein
MSNVIELVVDDQVVYFEIDGDTDDHFETLSPSTKNGQKVLIISGHPRHNKNSCHLDGSPSANI